MAHFRFRRSFGNVGTRRFRGVRPSGSVPAFSAEAQNYFDRLDTAGDTTYTAYKQPLANYIDSLVSLGGAYWDTMLSSASFVGVGIQGVTVPLRDGMTVPTQSNFVAADLDQLTGLKGDGSTKYLVTGLNATDLAQNDASISVYITTGDTASAYLAGAYSGTDHIVLRDVGSNSQVNMFSAGASSFGGKPTSGILGVSRVDSANQHRRANQVDYNEARSSVAAVSSALTVFAISGLAHTDARLATYHVGPALDLATLEVLQDTLIAQIAAI